MQAPVALPRCFAEILCPDFGFGSLREFRPRCRSFTVIHQVLPQNCASSVRKIYSQITLVQLCGIAIRKNKQRKNEKDRSVYASVSVCRYNLFLRKTAAAQQRAFKSVCCANASARRPLSSKTLNESNRGHAPRFCYFKREKVSAWELSDDSCSA